MHRQLFDRKEVDDLFHFCYNQHYNPSPLPDSRPGFAYSIQRKSPSPSIPVRFFTDQDEFAWEVEVFVLIDAASNQPDATPDVKEKLSLIYETLLKKNSDHSNMLKYALNDNGRIIKTATLPTANDAEDNIDLMIRINAEAKDAIGEILFLMKFIMEPKANDTHHPVSSTASGDPSPSSTM